MLPLSIALADAVNYALNQWNELSVYATDGAAPIDNNVSEREMKRIALNRNYEDRVIIGGIQILNGGYCVAASRLKMRRRPCIP